MEIGIYTLLFSACPRAVCSMFAHVTVGGHAAYRADTIWHDRQPWMLTNLTAGILM